jgi:predicted nucleotidyltransferase
MGEILDRRRSETARLIEKLRHELVRAEELCGDNACVYITGSFARGEASAHSDLDLFIVSQGTRKDPTLSRLNEILVKADLIESSKRLGLPEFSGDGQYLTHHTDKELIGTLGQPEDDVNNTFTARLLLLLESTPLIGKSAYLKITSDVVASYWRDYEDHRNDFMPAFLGNDILRMWRTFCVNYEARTQSAPPEKKAKRKLKNYKLKHSRLLTCYSALLYLLAVFSKNRTVSPTDAVEMISLTPTERLEWLLRQSELEKAHLSIHNLLKKYEEFLGNTDASEKDMVTLFLDKRKSKERLDSAYQFGDLVYDVFETIGELEKDGRFHRLLVV